MSDSSSSEHSGRPRDLGEAADRLWKRAGSMERALLDVGLVLADATKEIRARVDGHAVHIGLLWGALAVVSVKAFFL